MKWKQRELEFRGYIGQTAYGKLQGSSRWKYTREQTTLGNGIIGINDFHLEFHVDRKYVTRVQYIGVKDMNGKKIFEGDIVKFKSDDFKGIGVIKYDKAGFVVFSSRGTIELSFMNTVGTIEILGNVFQNPELIEKYNLEI